MNPLNILSEDELLFQQEIRKFAKTKIKPKVSEMDEKTVVCQFFNPTVSVTDV